MAADAIIRSDIDLEGDLIVAAVREEEIGGVGIKYLLESGIEADMGIVPESTNLMISTTGAGIAKFNISTLGKSVHVSARERGVDAIEKMSKVIDNLKRISFTHKPDPRVPKLPRYAAGTIIGGRGREYDLRGAQNLSDYCTLLVNVRFWKSMSEKSIEQDIKKMLESIVKNDPEFRYELKRGYGSGPFETNTLTRMPKDVDIDSKIVQVVKQNHQYVTKKRVRFKDPAETAGNDDGANMNHAGIQTITYGPGPRESEIEEYLSTPMSARWINLDTMHTSAKVMALSSYDVCKKHSY
jgi:acetylornithine deacetylase